MSDADKKDPRTVFVRNLAYTVTDAQVTTNDNTNARTNRNIDSPPVKRNLPRELLRVDPLSHATVHRRVYICVSPSRCYNPVPQTFASTHDVRLILITRDNLTRMMDAGTPVPYLFSVPDQGL